MILCCIFVSFCVTVREGRVTHELIHIINSAQGGASLTTLYSVVKLLSHMNACSCGGCDFSEFDCMFGEKCYLILVEPVEGKLGE